MTSESFNEVVGNMVIPYGVTLLLRTRKMVMIIITMMMMITTIWMNGMTKRKKRRNIISDISRDIRQQWKGCCEAVSNGIIEVNSVLM